MRGAGWFAAASLISSLAWGQSPAQQQARQQFQQGVLHAQAGELEAAMRAFEAAYAAQPHFSVLYNIGKTQAALGQPALAVASFERYLKDGGAQIANARRSEVEALIAASRRRLGSLRVVVAAPESTRVWLDGVEVTRERLEQPLVVPVGKHQLLHTESSGHLGSREVVVSNAETTEIHIAAPLETKAEAAQLAVRVAPRDARVLIDGRLAHGTAFTPGPHALRVEREGFQPFARTISLEAGKPLTFDITLTPTSTSRLPRDHRAGQRKTLGYLLSGSGAALVLSSASLFLWNQRRFADFQAHHVSGSGTEVDRVSSMQRVDDVALGLVVVGTGLVAGGLWFLSTNGAANE